MVAEAAPSEAEEAASVDLAAEAALALAEAVPAAAGNLLDL